LEHRQKSASEKAKSAPKGTFRSLESALKYLRSASAKVSLRDVVDCEEEEQEQEDEVVHRPNYFEMLERTLAISQQRLTRYRLKESPANVLLQPMVANIGLLDFHRGVEGIEAGRRCGKEMLPEIERCIQRCSAGG